MLGASPHLWAPRGSSAAHPHHANAGSVLRWQIDEHQGHERPRPTGDAAAEAGAGPKNGNGKRNKGDGAGAVERERESLLESTGFNPWEMLRKQ